METPVYSYFAEWQSLEINVSFHVHIILRIKYLLSLLMKLLNLTDTSNLLKDILLIYDGSRNGSQIQNPKLYTAFLGEEKHI